MRLIKILCEKNNWKEVFTDGDVNNILLFKII